MKDKIFVNRRSGCGVRVLVNPNDSRKSKIKGAAINPDMSHLKGVSFDQIMVVDGRLVKTERKFPLIAKSKVDMYLRKTKRAWRNRVIIDLLIIATVLHLIRFYPTIAEWVR